MVLADSDRPRPFPPSARLTRLNGSRCHDRGRSCIFTLPRPVVLVARHHVHVVPSCLNHAVKKKRKKERTRERRKAERRGENHRQVVNTISDLTLQCRSLSRLLPGCGESIGSGWAGLAVRRRSFPVPLTVDRSRWMVEYPSRRDSLPVVMLTGLMQLTTTMTMMIRRGEAGFDAQSATTHGSPPSPLFFLLFLLRSTRREHGIRDWHFQLSRPTPQAGPGWQKRGGLIERGVSRRRRRRRRRCGGRRTPRPVSTGIRALYIHIN